MGIAHEKTEISPLVEEVSIYIDAVRFRKVLGNQLSYCWEVERLLVAVVLDVAKAWVRFLL